MFQRTIMLMEAGIKPVWIFDGTPPDLKGQTLEKRKSRRTEARDEILNPDAPKKPTASNDSTTTTSTEPDPHPQPQPILP
jgi:5'-3' exonuclease